MQYTDEELRPQSIIESGGSHHWEEKQSLNDRRKWKLAEINSGNCSNRVTARAHSHQIPTIPRTLPARWMTSLKGQGQNTPAGPEGGHAGRTE